MDTSLMELGSPVGEGPVRGGERQARAAFRLVGRDRTVRWLMLIEALALTGLWVGFYLLRQKAGSGTREADRVFENWVYWILASGVATFCSVAVACAVDARIDGVEGGLRMAGDELRRRLPAVLGWWVISMAFVIGLGYGAEAVMRPLPALLAIGVVWGLGSLFVVPAIALHGGGPLAAVGEGLRLLRRRWGRALVGLIAIGFVAARAFIACGFLLRALLDGHGHGGELPWRFVVPLLVLYLTYALTAATRGTFGVIVARDALDDLPGEPPAAKPRRRRTTIARRIVLAVLAVLVGLVVLAAIFGHHRSHDHGTTGAPVRVPGPSSTRPVND
jgi:hypothetical protein